MEIVRFTNPTDPTKLDQGDIVNGLKSKFWVERYRKFGEFKFIADANGSVRNQLPIGSLISHTATSEVMIVENHEISADRGSEAQLTVSGRSFETFFEQRIVGTNVSLLGTILGPVEYNLGSAYTWIQAKQLLEDHILAENLIDVNNAIPFTSVITQVPGTGADIPRFFKHGDLYVALFNLLEIDNLGVRSIRPGSWSPSWGEADESNIQVAIYKGTDRSANVILSYDTGEIESADYLWSNKKAKNAAWIIGKWVQSFVSLGGTLNFTNRRTMLIMTDDFDSQFEEMPTEPEQAVIREQMALRALEVLRAQKDISITKVEASKESVRAIYRTDFNVGDIVTVHGDYNETESKRIDEYVEFEDSNGFVGYPTLVAI